MKQEAENLVLMGKVLRPHGVRGLLLIASYAESEDSFLSAGRLFIQKQDGVWQEEEVLSLHSHKGGFLVELKGLNSRERADGLRGASIFVEKESLKRENEEEFFWHEIIGLGVYLNTGRYIGQVKNILSTRGNDIYVVQSEGSEIMIPAVQGVVESIDLPGRKMTILEMEGLLDLNEA